MDRLFSAFPGGWAGLGLLGLRLALLPALVSVAAPVLLVRVPLACVAALMVAGLLTPLTAGTVVAIALGSAAWSLVTGGPLFFEHLRIHGLLAAIAVALLAIGPGAYSIDARLFGWRELHVPDP